MYTEERSCYLSVLPTAVYRTFTLFHPSLTIHYYLFLAKRAANSRQALLLATFLYFPQLHTTIPRRF